MQVYTIMHDSTRSECKCSNKNNRSVFRSNCSIIYGTNIGMALVVGIKIVMTNVVLGLREVKVACDYLLTNGFCC